ncbi:hypothetical protein EU811_22035 [Arthrobacter sp. TS-15]|nr:hypothetical protein EU811_22035 [Arthrobacter sp. TS-15]
MDESIPRALQPPVAVALAKLVKTFPRPGALPGVLYSEPKWDGFLHWTSSSKLEAAAGAPCFSNPPPLGQAMSVLAAAGIAVRPVVRAMHG